MTSKAKKISAQAFAIAIRRYDGPDVIDVWRIEPFTNKGRKDLLRQINRPAGERVIEVKITEAAKRIRSRTIAEAPV